MFIEIRYKHKTTPAESNHKPNIYVHVTPMESIYLL